MEYRYININDLNIDEISGKVSNERIERAQKYKSDDDRKRSIAVEYLLNEMVKGITHIPVTLFYDDKGKPHIYDAAGNDLIHFALSHSGDYVACIVGDRPCGIDIERHSEKRNFKKVAKRVCTERELSMINTSDGFYDLWTLKESVLKAVGLGLSLDMRKVELIFTGKNNTYTTVVEDRKYLGKVVHALEGYSLSYVELI